MREKSKSILSFAIYSIFMLSDVLFMIAMLIGIGFSDDGHSFNPFYSVEKVFAIFEIEEGNKYVFIANFILASIFIGLFIFGIRQFILAFRGYLVILKRFFANDFISEDEDTISFFFGSFGKLFFNIILVNALSALLFFDSLLQINSFLLTFGTVVFVAVDMLTYLLLGKFRSIEAIAFEGMKTLILVISVFLIGRRLLNYDLIKMVLSGFKLVGNGYLEDAPFRSILYYLYLFFAQPLLSMLAVIQFLKAIYYSVSNSFVWRYAFDPPERNMRYLRNILIILTISHSLAMVYLSPVSVLGSTNYWNLFDSIKNDYLPMLLLSIALPLAFSLEHYIDFSAKPFLKKKQIRLNDVAIPTTSEDEKKP